MTPVFAFLQDAKEALTELVTGLLMVAGGFLVGYVLGGILAWAAGRWIFRQKDTEVFKRLGRPVGGIILAIIVALIVFTGKGKPHGEGGEGKGAPDTDAGKNPAAKSPDAKSPDLPPVTLPDSKSAETPVLVTVYGGAKVRGEQFYRFENESQLRTLAGVQEAISARKAAARAKVTLQIRVPDNRDDRPGDPRIVTQLTEWANAQGMDVTFPAAK